MKKVSKTGVEIIVKNAEGDSDTKATVLKESILDYEPKVSVIIPVHNTEEYLRECLDSVINQTLKEIEIICIDDGSTDSSLEILKDYAQKDERFTIITQENRNAGVARNAGLTVARGDYLSILDSDDFFELDMLEKAYNNSKAYSAEITMFNCFHYDDINNEDKSVSWTLKVSDLKNSQLFSYKDEPDKIFTISNCWAWNRLFKTSFIKDIKLRFQDLKCANDTYFSCIALAEAKRISCLEERLVHYRTNRKAESKNLTTKSYRQKNPIDLLKCFFAIYKKLISLNKFSLLKESYIRVATEHIYWSKNGIIENNNAYKEFCKYFCEKFKDLYIKNQYKITDSVLLGKFSNLRNILVDEGIVKEIPKRIFYVWGVNEPKRDEVVKCINSWKKHLPDYEIVEINDDSKLYFNFQEELKSNEWFRTVYDHKMWAYVADYIRIKTIYENGGIYFDTDVSVVQNMDKFLKEPAFVGMQLSSLEGSGDYVEPAIYGAQKNNLLIGKIMEFYNEKIWQEPIYTMPQIFNYYLKEYNIFPFPEKRNQKIIKTKDITIYPEKYFIPYRYGENYTEKCKRKETHTIHWWGGSWVKPEVLTFLKNKHKNFKYMKKTKISVIIPVYNVEDYLAECLDSVIEQTLYPIEIICVNDGSTDNSAEILKEYVQKDSRIKVLYQENKGLGAARNYGVKNANSDYLFFLDSDDWLERDCLEKLYNKIVEKKSDICIYGLKKYDEKTKKNIQDDYFGLSMYNDAIFKNCTYKDIKSAIFKRFGAVLKLYSKNFFINNNIFFDEGVLFEDVFSHVKSLINAKNIAFLNERLYIYRVNRDNSIMFSSKESEKIFDVFEYLQKIYDFLKETNVLKEIEFEYYAFVLDQINFHLTRMSNFNLYERFREHFVKFSKDINLLKKIKNDSTLVKLYKNITVDFSIIVPVFNTEKFLSECIKSIINQTLKNIEIICINDGSSDNSLAILQEYAQKDERIKIIDQKNQGPSCSRNKALKFANGKYVMFVDSDDYLVRNTCEVLLNKAKTFNLDMLSFGGINFKDGTYEQYSNPYYEFRYLPDNFNINCFNYYDCKKFISKMAVSSCLTMYKNEFIKEKNIIFPPKIRFEDNLFFCKALTQAKRCGILRETLYFRRVHSLSITQNWAKHHGDYIKVADKVLKYLQSINIEKEIYEDYKSSYAEVVVNNYNKFEVKFQKKYYKLVKKFVKKYEPSLTKKIIKSESFIENIFSIKNTKDRKHKVLTVLGIKLKFKRKQKDKYCLLEKIFSVKNEESKNHKWHKVVRILGLKFSFKNNSLTQRKTFERLEKNINNIHKTQGKIIQQEKNLENQVQQNETNTQNSFQEIETLLLQTDKKLNELSKKQNECLTQHYLKSNFEIERCKEIVQQLETFDLSEKYKNLIKGLDEKSIECVSSLLAKVKRIAASESKTFDIFTDEEIKQITKLRKEYYPNIIQLAENCYAYKQYLLPIKHFEASVFYYKHNIDDLKDLDKIKNKSIIDVGAFIGDSAIVFEPYTNKKIYAFEPTIENYTNMLKTIQLNESTKIEPINKALGSKDEILEIFLQDSGSSINRIIKENPNKEQIEVTTLDKFVSENNIEVGLIKVDIEGFEQEFLKGAENTIRTQKPTLLISIYHNASDFFDIKPMIESWNLGYKFKIIKPIDGGIRGETLLIAEII